MSSQQVMEEALQKRYNWDTTGYTEGSFMVNANH